MDFVGSNDWSTVHSLFYVFTFNPICMSQSINHARVQVFKVAKWSTNYASDVPKNFRNYLNPTINKLFL